MPEMPEPFTLRLTSRPRRLRGSPSTRLLIQESAVSAGDLIAPLFVTEGKLPPVPVASMPGVFRLSVSDLVTECRKLDELGVPGVALFPSIEAGLKDAQGSHALDEDGLILRAVQAVKEAVPEMTVITDIALDPYTSHGHDGILSAGGITVANDETVAVLARMAVLHARSGVDFVAPSDMMDGRVGAIRRALDDATFVRTGILAYSAKFASAFYGPFRDAVGSATAPGAPAMDKKTYQLNPANRREAFREILLDEEEGADILMVKPAGPYLDIIREVREQTTLPIAAYQVSGEFARSTRRRNADGRIWRRA
ncbi:MAG: porphobilinogen synthase, partial [Opitutales bacterium]